ncbi:methylated-DNA--[protein]-cysteine S-methyltransferase [Carbonactinospora thermoautotrophica]|uniref:methylated-DNA--[protein]-cysteine S-methyltransferase n=1 Tax=Carbonactinospora thermoautotrophica TaxID=1469144 RepID=UPI003DA7DC5A
MRDLEALLRARLPDEPSGPPDLAVAAAREGLLDLAVGTTETPVGRLVLAVAETGLVACSYQDEAAVTERLARTVSPRVLRAPRRLDPVRRELDAYFAGRPQEFSVPVDLTLASPFGRAVLCALAQVPYGSTTTYGELAARLGRPRAARAVGHALGANPVCVVVPCHRVVGSSGQLTGYAGGVAAKRLLLKLEGVLRDRDDSRETL